jgi:hypothetical protein
MILMIVLLLAPFGIAAQAACARPQESNAAMTTAAGTDERTFTFTRGTRTATRQARTLHIFRPLVALNKKALPLDLSSRA